MNVQVDPIVLRARAGWPRLELDPVTGAPRRLQPGPDPGEGEGAQVDVHVALVTGGAEVRGRMGGLEYPGTHDVTLTRVDGAPRAAAVPGGTRFAVDVATSEPDRWRATWHHTLMEGATPRPRYASALEIHALSDDAVLRNVILEVRVRADHRDGWRVQSPGNPIRRDVLLADLDREVRIATAAGVDGSAGLVALERPGPTPRTVVVWPLCVDALGSGVLRRMEDGAALRWTTDVGGAPGAGGSLMVESLHLDLVAAPYATILASVPDALTALGVSAPSDPPDWAVATNLYEVQIGHGVFAGGYRYAPYPTAADLLADLPRIADLGFDCLQIMPRQPYPSYNVHDYSDITTSYGDETVLRRIVEACHARGMRVILDILMHGVIDGEIVAETVAGIRSGPFADRLDTVIPDVTSLDYADPVEGDLYPIAWAAHVVHFGPDWTAGSPWRHALADAHPEWFCRDSSGRITGMYTKAFDLDHPDWQRWFIDAALDLVRRLDIDGFRFDAPSYNEFHNWSETARAHASASMVGCFGLFERLRPELRSLRPDALLYTEPSGVLYRRTMDVTYNYDEQFLVRSVVSGGAGRGHWVRHARDLARWFADRDASLPRGSLTAHHLDSHDTFWWPHPGQKWRREQIGIPATAAFMTAFALTGGPMMTFVGGEMGIEEQVRRVNRLRRDWPALHHGTLDVDAVRADADEVYAIVRRAGPDTALVLINLSDHEVTSRLHLTLDPHDERTADAFGGPDLAWSRSGGGWVTDVALPAWATVACRLGG